MVTLLGIGFACLAALGVAAAFTLPKRAGKEATTGGPAAAPKQHEEVHRPRPPAGLVPDPRAGIADELHALIQSIKRTELVDIEQAALGHGAWLRDGKEPFPTDAQLKDIERWGATGAHSEFRSGNSVFVLYGKARLAAGFAASVKADRVRGALDNADFFHVALNGYKKYPGLQTREDVVAGAELFGELFPLVTPSHAVFTVSDRVVYSEENENDMILRVVSNVYKTEMTAEPYRNPRR